MAVSRERLSHQPDSVPKRPMNSRIHSGIGSYQYVSAVVFVSDGRGADSLAPFRKRLNSSLPLSITSRKISGNCGNIGINRLPEPEPQMLPCRTGLLRPLAVIEPESPPVSIFRFPLVLWKGPTPRSRHCKIMRTIFRIASFLNSQSSLLQKEPVQDLSPKFPDDCNDDSS